MVAKSRVGLLCAARMPGSGVEIANFVQLRVLRSIAIRQRTAAQHSHSFCQPLSISTVDKHCSTILNR
jgi:hypothetical protein